MKRSIKTLAALALCAFAATATAQNNVVDEVVWVVGDAAILKSDIEQMRIEAQMMGQRLDGDPYCVLPEQIAIQKLFLHQAEIDSVQVTDAEVLQEVEARLDDYVQRFGSREKLEEYMGKTMSQFRSQMFDMLKENIMIQEVRRSLVKDIKVTPAQVRRYIKDLPEDSIPFIPTRYEVQILVRHPIIPQEEIDRVKNELRDYTERINSGKDQFSTLALLYSQDGSASRGGELGFMGRGQLVPEFSSVAFNLTDPKTVSKIVETEFGFHIIQLIEKRGDRVNVRHILRKPKVSDKALEAALAQMDTIVTDINDTKYTFDEAVTAYSQDKDTRANYGLLFYKDQESGMTGTPRMELRQMPPDVAKQVASLEVGEMSKPFIMVDDHEREVVVIAKVKAKVNGHRATMKDDYQELQDMMVERMREQKLDDWIREAQKKTYVRINDDWRNCEFKYPGWIK